MMADRCDVVVAHSPPTALFAAGSQPELSAVFYQNLRLVMPRAQSPLAARRFNSRGAAPNSPKTVGAAEDCGAAGGCVATAATGESKGRRTAGEPRRPCLVNRADSDGSLGSSSSSDENEPASPTRRKKKVVFADDRGLSLTQVRLMSEPSNQPPKLMSVGPYLLNQNQQTAAAGESSSSTGGPRWRLQFPQPASNYLDFRHRLDTGNVSLENVIVRSPDRRIVGTVKVRNVSYDKVVFVRSTEDGWATHRDTACSYVRNNGLNTSTSAGRRNMGPTAPGSGSGGQPSACNGVTAIYDTFSFRLPLPAAEDAASVVEFAVCYKSDDFECWDNNSGDNYRLSVDRGADERPSASQPTPVVPAIASADRFVSGFDCCGDVGVATSAPQDSPQPLSPVHYFGAHSGLQNSLTSWRNPRAAADTSAYW